MQKKDKISVIIPSFNRAFFLDKCINSLCNQTYRPLEVLIIDDGSSDNTRSVVKKYIKRWNSSVFQIKYFHQKNMGAQVARNRGIKESTGDWLQFLDSDDYLEKEKLEIQLKSLKKFKADLAICDYKIINEEKKTISLIKNNGNLLLRVAKGHSLFTGSVLIMKSIVEKKILWNEKLYREQDKEFLFKVLFLSKKYVYNNNTFAIYIKHNQDQITDTYSKTKPQGMEVIRSNIKYLLKNKHQLSFYRVILIILHIFHITLRLIILYKIKKLIKKLFLNN